MKKKSLISGFSYTAATFFGIGYFPKAPGTAASLATLPIAFLLTHYGGFFASLAFLALVYFLGTIASKEVLKYTEHDPSFIVIDEVAGQLVPLIFFPYIFFFIYGIWLLPNEWWTRAALPAFILFRIFDIVKPFPVSYFDKKVLNAHGVMLDDIAAGIYALLVMAIAYAGIYGLLIFSEYLIDFFD
jgi:phosphatidylglycerophosphatase A